MVKMSSWDLLCYSSCWEPREGLVVSSTNSEHPRPPSVFTEGTETRRIKDLFRVLKKGRNRAKMMGFGAWLLPQHLCLGGTNSPKVTQKVDAKEKTTNRASELLTLSQAGNSRAPWLF